MMKPPKTRLVKGKRYYRYGVYSNYSTARKTANYFKRMQGSRYFIDTYEDGFFFPQIKYALYLNKVVSFV